MNFPQKSPSSLIRLGRHTRVVLITSCSDFLLISKASFLPQTLKYHRAVRGEVLSYSHPQVSWQQQTVHSSCDAPLRRPTVTSRSFVQMSISPLSSISSPSSKTELWPPLFHLQIMNQRPLLREIHDWVKAHPVPMCMFMPDRLPDANAHRANQMAFDELAGLLMQNQWVGSCSFVSYSR